MWARSESTGGVGRYPEQASYGRGVSNEALMLYFSLAKRGDSFRILRGRSPSSHPSTVGPEWAIADRPLFKRAATPECPGVQVDALSPSSATVRAAITNFRQFITEDAQSRRPVATHTKPTICCTLGAVRYGWCSAGRRPRRQWTI
jgi:hypothetical protein